jgi:hypothetical protein
LLRPSNEHVNERLTGANLALAYVLFLLSGTASRLAAHCRGDMESFHVVDRIPNSSSHCLIGSISGKWLELLKEIAPSIKRAAVIRTPDVSPGIGPVCGYLGVCTALGIDVSPINVRDVEAMQIAIADFARLEGGLIVTAAGGIALWGNPRQTSIIRHNSKGRGSLR